MLPPSLEYVKNMKPRQLLEAMKHFKAPPNSGGMRITLSDKGGPTTSTGRTMPNSSVTDRIGSSQRGAFERKTQSVRGLGSFTQVDRKSTYSAEPNTTAHVNRILGSSSNPRPFRGHTFRSGGGRTRRSKSDTANMLHDVSKWVSKKTPNFIKRIASKGFNSI
jgi:hypothetical protein